MGHLAFVCYVCVYVRVRLFLSLFRRETGWVTPADKKLRSSRQKNRIFLPLSRRNRGRSSRLRLLRAFHLRPTRCSAAKSTRPSSICRLFRKFSPARRSFLSYPATPSPFACDLLDFHCRTFGTSAGGAGIPDSVEIRSLNKTQLYRFAWHH